jgi:heat shock protein HtpX
MAAYGLYTHIRKNRIRSAFLLVGLFGLVYVLTFAGALVGEAMGGDASIEWLLRAALRDLVVAAPFVTVGTLVWMLIAYRFHQAMIDALTGGHDVTRKDEPRLYNLLENLCISRGIPMPRLKLVDNSALNAFATGLNQRQYAISVTQGLRDRLDDAEIEAVLGHELTHIRNGDVRMMVIAVIMAGVISFFAELFFRMFFQSGVRWRGREGGGRKGSGGAFLAIVIAVVLIALAWLLSIMIRFALSRQREYLADAGAVELTKNPDAMITALRKIEGRGELEGSTSAVMEMCVDNPRSGFVDLFATHPSIDDRVAALIRFAGGHDPGPIALEPAPEPESLPQPDEAAQEPAETPAERPFLPEQSPLATPAPTQGGPWGPARG